MYVVITLCLIYMLALVAGFICKMAKLDRSERLKYLKGFKKGKFSLIYLATVPLYYIGLLYSGEGMGVSAIKAIKLSIDTVVLKFGYDDISALLGDNMYYFAVIGICYALVVVNAFIFVLAFTAEKIYNSVKKIKIDRLASVIHVVVGGNKHSKSIIKSVKGEHNVIWVVEKLDEATIDFAYSERVAVVELCGNLKTTLGNTLKSLDKKVVNVIINTESDVTDLKYTEELSELILTLDYKEYSFEEKRGLYVYVFGDPESTSAFYHYEKKTNGCVKYLNKYKLIATDFTARYPLTEFMTSKELDYDTATLRSDVAVNVVMVGFGKTTRQMFLTSVANNQFLTKTADGRLTVKPVNYFIYDKEASQNNKNLNHNYFRYGSLYGEMLANKEEYLPLPEMPSNEQFYKLDINSCDFYSSVKSNLTNGGRSAYNYVIVSYGSDMENLDMAEKLCEKLKEWGVFGNTKMFVKIRDDALAGKVVEKEYASPGGYVIFGTEASTVYNINRIVAEKNESMAKYRHVSYAFEYKEDGETESDVIRKATEEWYTKWQQIQREANVYACASIKMKLELLGYDLSDDKDAVDASDDFIAYYSQGDEIVYDGREIRGKRLVDYGDCNFKANTRRNALAVQEHARWNAYEISSGYVPATKQEIITMGKSELIAMRKHRNITTFEGLYEYRKMMAELTGKKESQTDVIKYDYQLMDDLTWLLRNSGFKIVKREK